MSSAFRYFAIGLLCAFYALVLVLARDPTVDQPYRLFYIDKDLRYWPGDPRLRYRPGTVIDLSNASPFLSRHGWSRPERSGIWMIENSAKLYLVPRPLPDEAMELRVQASAFIPDRSTETIVEVSLNAERVGRWVFHRGDGSMEFRSLIPAATLVDAPTPMANLTAVAFDMLDLRSPDYPRFARRRKMLGLKVSAVCLTPVGADCADRHE
jgi:hypothetical protein